MSLKNKHFKKLEKVVKIISFIFNTWMPALEAPRQQIPDGMK